MKKRQAPLKSPLHGFRKRLKLSQNTLAEVFGVSETTYRVWEKCPPAWAGLACHGLAVSMVVDGAVNQLTAADMIRIRKALGISQEELAEALNVSRATIGRYEAGEPPAWAGLALRGLVVRHTSTW